MPGRGNRDVHRTNRKARENQRNHSVSLNSYIDQALQAQEEGTGRKAESPAKKAGHRNKSSRNVHRRPGSMSVWSRYLCRVRACVALGQRKAKREKEEIQLRARLLNLYDNNDTPSGVSQATYTNLVDDIDDIDDIDEMKSELAKLTEHIAKDETLLTELEAERDALAVVVGHTTVHPGLPEHPPVNLALFVLNMHPTHDTEDEITRNVFINKGEFTLLSWDWRVLKLTSKAFAEFVMRNCVLDSRCMVSMGSNGRCRAIHIKGSIQFIR